MRSLILAGVAAAGFGLLGASSTIAAPAGGTVLAPLSTQSSVVDVRYRCYNVCGHRWHSRRGCWRRCRWW